MFSQVLNSKYSSEAFPHNEEKASNVKLLWYIWLIVAFTMVMLQALTIDVLPSLMQDEAQITDYGRLALDPVSRWSVTWWIAGNKPLFLWSYLGPIFAEFGYQLGGASGIGPRIMSLIGGLTASIMALGWLIERKVPAIIAGLLAFAFLLDPLFTMSQRMGRVDSWVMAFCLASCWLLSLSSRKSGSSKITLVILSGILAASASFIWPSAVFLYPLVCLELFRSSFESSNIKMSFSKIIRYSTYFILGGLFIAVVLIIPIRHQLVMIFGDMKNLVGLNVNATKTPAERVLTLFSFQPWAKLIKAFAKTLSPGLPLLALWAFLFRREKGLLLISFLTISVILLTLIYEFRIIYLLPYFLALSGDLFRRLGLHPIKPAIKRISLAFLAIAVIWAIGVSIILRSTIGLNERSLRNRTLISNAATSAIGPGNYKVFLAFTYEFYFTGRSLGWQVYTPYIQFSYDAAGNWIRKDDFQPKDKFIKLMSHMDYAIFPAGTMNDELGQQLKLSGLTYKSTIHVSDELINKTEKSPFAGMNTIVLWFLRGANSYGPYLFYARSDKKILSVRTNKIAETSDLVKYPLRK